MADILDQNGSSLPGTGTFLADTSRPVTALFDSRSSADAAIARLADAGIPHDAIRLMPGAEADTAQTTEPAGGGFWETLKDLFLPDQDRHAYAEGLSRGGYLVSVQVSAADYDRVSDILDQDGTLDIEEQTAQWRAGGWTGYTGADYTGAGLDAGVGSGLTGLDYAGAAGAAAAGGAFAGRDESGPRTTDPTKIQEHMEVIAADGQSIGRVDHLDGDRIKLTRNDSPDHEHHHVPFSWIDHIDRHVHLNKSLAEIKAGR